MARVTIRKTGTITVDTNAVADVAVHALVGAIVQRQHDGLDANDAKFKGYSAGYQRELLSKGEAVNVDHHRTGLLWTQIKELRRKVQAVGTAGLGMAPVVTATVGVGTAGQRNLIGAWLQKLRRWFGASPKDRRTVVQAVAKMKGLVKTKPGTTTKTFR